MSDGMSLEFDNLGDWMDELSRLPEVMQKRVVLGAVATGASVIRKEVVARAPVWTGPVSEGHPPPGTLKKAIYQARMVQECTPTQEVWKVSVRTGKSQKHDAFYAKWVEYGHYTATARSIKGTRAQRRATARASGQAHWVAAKPFFRPAFDTKQAEALQAMQDYINQNLPLAAASFRYIRAIS